MDNQDLAPPSNDRLVFRILTRASWKTPTTLQDAFLRRGDEDDLSIICKDDDSPPTCDEVFSIGIAKSHGYMIITAEDVRALRRFPKSDPNGAYLDINRKDALRAGINTPDPNTQWTDANAVALNLMRTISGLESMYCRQRKQAG